MKPAFVRRVQKGVFLNTCAGAVIAASFMSPAQAQDASTESPADTSPVETQADPLATSGEPIVVTGSRIARSGFTAPTPVTVLGGDRIQELGVTSVGELLEDIPSFRPTSSPQTAGVTIGAGGARTVDLRALGAPRSLVLVNSRRFVPSTAQGTVDTNLVPSILVDRVEIVTGGASAAYGSDAVAGVVNFILDNNLQGLRSNVQVGINEDGDDADYLIGLAAGTSFAGGRGHFIIGGEWNRNEGSTRGCYADPLCSQEWQVLTNPTPGVNGYPAFYLTDDVHTGLLTQGGRIISPAPLNRIQFDADGNPVPFEPGILAGLFMGGGSGHGENPFRSAGWIKVPVERTSVFGRGEYEITPSLTGFIEGSYGRVEVTTEGAQPRDFGANNLRIAYDNPYMPESIRDRLTPGTTLVIGRAGDDFGTAIGYSTTQTYRGAAGIDGNIDGNWKWNAYYQYGQTDFQQIVENNRITANWLRAVDAVRSPESGDIVCRTTLSPDPAVREAAAGCQPINIFGQNNFTQAGKDYAWGTGRQDTMLKQHVIAANIQGDIVDLWAGPLSFAAGAEYRSDKVSGEADPISSVNGFYIANGQSFSAPAVEVKEAYAELNLPLLGGVRFAEMLELNGAVRLTDYSTSGTVTTWKVGAIYEPINGIRLRGTRSRDIRAPNALELFSPITTSFASILDSSTGGNPLARIFSGGNPELNPEIADTWTVGVVLQPAFASGLRFSADYYNIEIEDAIGTTGAQTIADRCIGGAQEYCALLTRDPGTGEVSEVRDQFQNINQLVTSGVDFELSYVRPVGAGRVTFRGLATYVDELITTDGAGSTDRAGMTGAPVSQLGGVPDWIFDGTLTYDQNPFAVTLQGRYIPKGTYDVRLIGPDDPGYDISLPNSINNNTVDDFLTFNLSARYTVEIGNNRTVQLFGAVNNLFNEKPPLAPSSQGYTNGILFDQLGRGFRFGVRTEL